MIVRVDGRRSRVEQHLRLVNRGRHGLDGGPDAGMVGEGDLVGAGDLAYLQNVENPLCVLLSAAVFWCNNEKKTRGECYS